MEKISVLQVPTPTNLKPGQEDLVIGWFPEPLIPLEQRILVGKGALIDRIGGQSGYFTDASLGTIPYDRAQELKEKALDQIRQNPTQRYLAVISHKD